MHRGWSCWGFGIFGLVEVVLRRADGGQKDDEKDENIKPARFHESLPREGNEVKGFDCRLLFHLRYKKTIGENLILGFEKPYLWGLIVVGCWLRVKI